MTATSFLLLKHSSRVVCLCWSHTLCRARMHSVSVGWEGVAYTLHTHYAVFYMGSRFHSVHMLLLLANNPFKYVIPLFVRYILCLNMYIIPLWVSAESSPSEWANNQIPVSRFGPPTLPSGAEFSHPAVTHWRWSDKTSQGIWITYNTDN